jgi:hypothetical protein
MPLPFGPIADDDVSGFNVASFRTLGTAASPQNIFTIENPAASGHLIMIVHLSVVMDSTAVLTSVAPSLNLSRPTALPTGGTTTTHVPDITGTASVAVCRSATASDGGGATAITATPGATWRTALSMRLHTAVGIVLSDKLMLIGPLIAARDYGLLKAGEAALVQGVLASAATTHFVVNVKWKDLTQ